MTQHDEPEDFLQADDVIRRLWSVICDDELPLDLRDEGIERLRVQAEDGKPYAQLLLGRLYRDGPLLTPDWVEARHWFEQAARGLPDAQYVLGKLYWEGEDIPQDMGQAVYWLTRAAKQAHPYAQLLLER